MSTTPKTVIEATQKAALGFHHKAEGLSAALKYKLDEERDVQTKLDKAKEGTELARAAWRENNEGFEEVKTFLRENGQGDWVRNLTNREL